MFVRRGGVGETSTSTMSDATGRPEDMAFPPTGKDVGLTLLCAVGGAMAASSGVGGGVLFVPLLVVLAGLPVAYAAPISNFVIACSAVSTFVLHLFETHPKNPKRPLLNFEALIYFVPIAVSSTSLGVMMSKALPEWLVNLMLFSFLLFTSYRMCSRAKKTFGEEIKAKYTRKAGPETVAALRANVLGPGQAAEGGHDEGDYLLRIQGKTKAANGGGGEVEERADGAGATGGNSEAEGGAADQAVSSADVEVGVLKGLRRDPSYESDLKVAATLRERVFETEAEGGAGDASRSGEKGGAKEEVVGGGGSPEGGAPEALISPTYRLSAEVLPARDPSAVARLRQNVRSTEWWYWVVIFGTWGLQVYFSVLQKKARSCTVWDFVLLAGQPVTGVLIGLVIARLLIARHLGGKSKFAYEKGDIAMGETWPRMGKMMAFCLCIGAMGGLLGVGGGSILAPMLLELGASAVVSAPISSSLVLFSSSQAAVQYAVGGKLLWNYAIWLASINLVANFVGLYAVKRIVQRLGYSSFIIASLGVLLVVATTFTAIFLVGDLEKNGFEPFPMYCRQD